MTDVGQLEASSGSCSFQDPANGAASISETQVTAAGKEKQAQARPWLLKLVPSSNTCVHSRHWLEQVMQPNLVLNGREKAVLSVSQRRGQNVPVAQITTMGRVGSIRKGKGRECRGEEMRGGVGRRRRWKGNREGERTGRPGAQS